MASLAQGVVHWGPPRAALRAAAAATAAALENEPHSAGGGPLNSYGPTPGLPALRAALKRQLVARGLPGYAPVVTPGANCAFTVALLALCDEGDSVSRAGGLGGLDRFRTSCCRGPGARVVGCVVGTARENPPRWPCSGVFQSQNERPDDRRRPESPHGPLH